MWLMVLANFLELNVRACWLKFSRMHHSLSRCLDIDTITLGPNLVIPEQSIGVASTSKGLDDGVDGILG